MTALQNNHVELIKQEDLLAKLRGEGWSFAALARRIGVTRGAVPLWFAHGRAPIERVQALRNAGVSEHLLPKAENITPGPKPKPNREEACHEQLG